MFIIKVINLFYNFLLQFRDGDIVDVFMDWEVQFIKEFIVLLSIKVEKDMGDEVWYEVVENFGYILREINNFSCNDNLVVVVIVDYKRRGGMLYQFIVVLYKIGILGNMIRQKMSSGSGSIIIDEY